MPLFVREQGDDLPAYFYGFLPLIVDNWFTRNFDTAGLSNIAYYPDTREEQVAITFDLLVEGNREIHSAIAEIARTGVMESSSFPKNDVNWIRHDDFPTELLSTFFDEEIKPDIISRVPQGVQFVDCDWTNMPEMVKCSLDWGAENGTIKFKVKSSSIRYRVRLDVVYPYVEYHKMLSESFEDKVNNRAARTELCKIFQSEWRKIGMIDSIGNQKKAALALYERMVGIYFTAKNNRDID